MNQIPSRAYFNAFLFAVLLGLIAASVQYIKLSQLPKKVFLTAHLEVSERGVSQMFFDTGGGYSEEGSAKLSFIPAETHVSLRFPFPDAQVQSIRFDPTNGRKPVTLKSLAFETSNGVVLKRIDLSAVEAVAPFSEVQSEGNAIMVSIPEGTQDSDSQTRLALEYPVQVSYSNQVFFPAASRIGFMVSIFWMILWTLIRFLYGGTMFSFICTLPRTLKENFYLINRPEL